MVYQFHGRQQNRSLNQLDRATGSTVGLTTYRLIRHSTVVLFAGHVPHRDTFEVFNSQHVCHWLYFLSLIDALELGQGINPAPIGRALPES